MRKDIEFLNKTQEEMVSDFMLCRGQGALIVESQTIDAVCEAIESLQSPWISVKEKINMELSNKQKGYLLALMEAPERNATEVRNLTGNEKLYEIANAEIGMIHELKNKLKVS